MDKQTENRIIKQAKYAVDDIISNHVGTIKGTQISVGNGKNGPVVVYYGDMVNNKNQPIYTKMWIPEPDVQTPPNQS